MTKSIFLDPSRKLVEDATTVPPTAVTPGAYGGSPAQTVYFTVGADGRLTAAGVNTISIAASQVGSGSFGTSFITDDAITNAKLRNSAALSVIGRSTNSTGDPADIAAASDHQVFRRSGSGLGFGAVALNQAAAVTGSLPIGNGGTGATTAANARTALGLGSAATANTGTSGATIPLLNTTVTVSALWTFNNRIVTGHVQQPSYPVLVPGASQNLDFTENAFLVLAPAGTGTTNLTFTAPTGASVCLLMLHFIGGRTYNWPASTLLNAAGTGFETSLVVSPGTRRTLLIIFAFGAWQLIV